MDKSLLEGTQENLIKQFAQAVELEYLKQSSTPSPPKWSQIKKMVSSLKWLLNISINGKNQQKIFVEYLLKYTELVMSFLSSFDESDYRKQKHYAESCLRFVPEILKDIEFKNLFVQEATVKIFDLFMYGDFNFVSKSTLLTMFNEVISQSKKQVRIELANNIEYYKYKLLDCLSTYGDYVLQSDVMETLFRIFGDQIRNKRNSYELLPGSEDLGRALMTEISVHRFDADVRKWLNKFNEKSPNIFSIACKKVMYGNNVCQTPEDIDKMWVDFNLIEHMLSFHCEGSNPDSWNRIIVLAKDVKKTQVKRPLGVNESTVILQLYRPCISEQRESQDYWDCLDKQLRLIISNEEKDRLNSLIAHVLPQVFGDTFSHNSDRISIHPKQLYKPLGIKVSKKRSSISDVSSITSATRSTTEISSVTSDTKETVSAKTLSSETGTKSSFSLSCYIMELPKDVSCELITDVSKSSRKSDTTTGHVSIITSNQSDMLLSSNATSPEKSETVTSCVQSDIDKLQDNIVTSSHEAEDDNQSSIVEILSGRCSSKSIDYQSVVQEAFGFEASEVFSSSPIKNLNKKNTQNGFSDQFMSISLLSDENDQNRIVEETNKKNGDNKMFECYEQKNNNKNQIPRGNKNPYSQEILDDEFETAIDNLDIVYSELENRLNDEYKKEAMKNDNKSQKNTQNKTEDDESSQLKKRSNDENKKKEMNNDIKSEKYTQNINENNESRDREKVSNDEIMKKETNNENNSKNYSQNKTKDNESPGLEKLSNDKNREIKNDNKSDTYSKNRTENDESSELQKGSNNENMKKEMMNANTKSDEHSQNITEDNESPKLEKHLNEKNKEEEMKNDNISVKYSQNKIGNNESAEREINDKSETEENELLNSLSADRLKHIPLIVSEELVEECNSEDIFSPASQRAPIVQPYTEQFSELSLAVHVGASENQFIIKNQNENISTIKKENNTDHILQQLSCDKTIDLTMDESESVETDSKISTKNSNSGWIGPKKTTNMFNTPELIEILNEVESTDQNAIVKDKIGNNNVSDSKRSQPIKKDSKKNTTKGRNLIKTSNKRFNLEIFEEVDEKSVENNQVPAGTCFTDTSGEKKKLEEENIPEDINEEQMLIEGGEIEINQGKEAVLCQQPRPDKNLATNGIESKSKDSSSGPVLAVEIDKQSVDCIPTLDKIDKNKEYNMSLSQSEQNSMGTMMKTSDQIIVEAIKEPNPATKDNEEESRTEKSNKLSGFILKKKAKPLLEAMMESSDQSVIEAIKTKSPAAKGNNEKLNENVQESMFENSNNLSELILKKSKPLMITQEYKRENHQNESDNHESKKKDNKKRKQKKKIVKTKSYYKNKNQRTRKKSSDKSSGESAEKKKDNEDSTNIPNEKEIDYVVDHCKYIQKIAGQTENDLDINQESNQENQMKNEQTSHTDIMLNTDVQDSKQIEAIHTQTEYANLDTFASEVRIEKEKINTEVSKVIPVQESTSEDVSPHFRKVTVVAEVHATLNGNGNTTGAAFDKNVEHSEKTLSFSEEIRKVEKETLKSCNEINELKRSNDYNVDTEQSLPKKRRTIKRLTLHQSNEFDNIVNEKSKLGSSKSMLNTTTGSRKRKLFVPGNLTYLDEMLATTDQKTPPDFDEPVSVEKGTKTPRKKRIISNQQRKSRKSTGRDDSLPNRPEKEEKPQKKSPTKKRKGKRKEFSINESRFTSLDELFNYACRDLGINENDYGGYHSALQTPIDVVVRSVPQNISTEDSPRDLNQKHSPKLSKNIANDKTPPTSDFSFPELEIEPKYAKPKKINILQDVVIKPKTSTGALENEDEKRRTLNNEEKEEENVSVPMLQNDNFGKEKADPFLEQLISLLKFIVRLIEKRYDPISLQILKSIIEKTEGTFN